ncbi:hypothetical protein OUZ56_020462 [Daphnia magna]|uniref:Uncharacterized protein n=1 Tax=Daphnia magna TaxID=35525 RepID=A0ABQ9ZEJ1_9CRUS|nr:hypothetical protein OUZ56_020462 [Daphnia magna]
MELREKRSQMELRKQQRPRGQRQQTLKDNGCGSSIVPVLPLSSGSLLILQGESADGCCSRNNPRATFVIQGKRPPIRQQDDWRVSHKVKTVYVIAGNMTFGFTFLNSQCVASTVDNISAAQLSSTAAHEPHS